MFINGRVEGQVTRLHFSNHTFGIGEARHFKSRMLIDTHEYYCMHDMVPPKGMRLE